MLEKLQTLFKRRVLDRPKINPPSATTLAPVVVIACGAGMAFWWWSQWARSREEARQAKPADGQVTDVVGPEAADALTQSLAVQADVDQANDRPPTAA